MNEVLLYIAEHLGFLWDQNVESNDYRITHSISAPGSGCVVITSSRIRIQLAAHHGELSMDLEPAFIERRDGYIRSGSIPIELLQEVITGQRSSGRRITPAHARFLQEHLGDVVARMTPDQWPVLRAQAGLS